MITEAQIKTARSHLRFFFLTLETAELVDREAAASHNGKEAYVYATYRDRSVFAVECSRR